MRDWRKEYWELHAEHEELKRKVMELKDRVNTLEHPTKYDLFVHLAKHDRGGVVLDLKEFGRKDYEIVERRLPT